MLQFPVSRWWTSVCRTHASPYQRLHGLSQHIWLFSHRIHKESSSSWKLYSKPTCPRSIQGRTKAEVISTVMSITGQNIFCPQGKTCKRSGMKGKLGEAAICYSGSSQQDLSHLLWTTHTLLPNRSEPCLVRHHVMNHGCVLTQPGATSVGVHDFSRAGLVLDLDPVRISSSGTTARFFCQSRVIRR